MFLNVAQVAIHFKVTVTDPVNVYANLDITETSVTNAFPYQVVNMVIVMLALSVYAVKVGMAFSVQNVSKNSTTISFVFCTRNR